MAKKTSENQTIVHKIHRKKSHFGLSSPPQWPRRRAAAFDLPTSRRRRWRRSTRWPRCPHRVLRRRPRRGWLRIPPWQKWAGNTWKSGFLGYYHLYMGSIYLYSLIYSNLFYSILSTYLSIYNIYIYTYIDTHIYIYTNNMYIYIWYVYRFCL